jgi:hypothetical protein
VHPNRTVRVGCMVGSSSWTWHDTQPALFASASACDCVNSVSRETDVEDWGDGAAGMPVD